MLDTDRVSYPECVEIAEPGDRGWVSVSCPARDKEEAGGERTVWDHVQVSF